MDTSVKVLLPMAAFGVLLTSARADWKDLKPGMDQQAAIACAGVPLMQNRGKGGAEVWTYDHRGYIEFSFGRVIYWSASMPPKRIPSQQAPQIAAPARKPGKSPVKKA